MHGIDRRSFLEGARAPRESIVLSRALTKKKKKLFTRHPCNHTHGDHEKRRKIKRKKGDTPDKVARVLRENPCHCLYRREEVLESVNSFRGNKHGC